MRNYLIGIFFLFSFSCYSQVTIVNPGKDPQVAFGIKKIREAAQKKKITVSETSAFEENKTSLFRIEIVTDSGKAKTLI